MMAEPWGPQKSVDADHSIHPSKGSGEFNLMRTLAEKDEWRPDLNDPWIDLDAMWCDTCFPCVPLAPKVNKKAKQKSGA